MVEQKNINSAFKQAALNYAGAAAFAAFIGAMSFWNGDAANLVAMKAIFGPFFLLAIRALPTFFKDPVNMNGLNAQSVETQILSALLVAGFFVIAIWTPLRPLTTMASDFAIMFTTMSVVNLLVLTLRQRRTKSTKA